MRIQITLTVHASGNHVNLHKAHKNALVQIPMNTPLFSPCSLSPTLNLFKRANRSKASFSQSGTRPPFMHPSPSGCLFFCFIPKYGDITSEGFNRSFFGHGHQNKIYSPSFLCFFTPPSSSLGPESRFRLKSKCHQREKGGRGLIIKKQLKSNKHKG